MDAAGAQGRACGARTARRLPAGAAWRHAVHLWRVQREESGARQGYVCCAACVRCPASRGRHPRSWTTAAPPPHPPPPTPPAPTAHVVPLQIALRRASARTTTRTTARAPCTTTYGASTSRRSPLSARRSRVGAAVAHGALPHSDATLEPTEPACPSAGMAPNPRTAFGLVTHKKRVVLFGGIVDQEGKVRLYVAGWGGGPPSIPLSHAACPPPPPPFLPPTLSRASACTPSSSTSSTSSSWRPGAGIRSPCALHPRRPRQRRRNLLLRGRPGLQGMLATAAVVAAAAAAGFCSRRRRRRSSKSRQQQRQCRAAVAAAACQQA